MSLKAVPQNIFSADSCIYNVFSVVSKNFLTSVCIYTADSISVDDVSTVCAWIFSPVTFLTAHLMPYAIKHIRWNLQFL